MRTRRSDGLWIVFLGLLVLIAALSVLPKAPASGYANTHHLSRPSSV